MEGADLVADEVEEEVEVVVAGEGLARERRHGDGEDLFADELGDKLEADPVAGFVGDELDGSGLFELAVAPEADREGAIGVADRLHLGLDGHFVADEGEVVLEDPLDGDVFELACACGGGGVDGDAPGGEGGAGELVEWLTALDAACEEAVVDAIRDDDEAAEFGGADLLGRSIHGFEEVGGGAGRFGERSRGSDELA